MISRSDATGRRWGRRTAGGLGAVVAVALLVGCADPAGRSGIPPATQGPAGAAGATRTAASPADRSSGPQLPPAPTSPGSPAWATPAAPDRPTDGAGSDGTGASPTAVGADGGPDRYRPGVLPSTRIEPPPDADRPDGPAPVPDRDLTAADLTGLIRQPASDPVDDRRCTPADVRLSLSGLDAAAGHRYAQLVAAAAGDRTCELRGWPGLGFRGAWGTAFPVIAEQVRPTIGRVGVPVADPGVAVSLPPGGRAVADLEWTGALAGNRQERTSLIAVQFADGGAAAALPVPAGSQIDLGAETTVRIGPWGAAGT